MHKPSWFKDDEVLISFAPTCGIYKKGDELFKIDPKTGKRTKELDDLLRADVAAAVSGESTETMRWVPAEEIKSSTPVVPVYFDDRPLEAFEATREKTWPNYGAVSLGELIAEKQLVVGGGHGSPSSDVRRGTIPYIKVSDIRAGQININPTNRVPEVVARLHWGGKTSGLNAFDIVTPNRASKNIGEVAIVMPGQERVVLTKEVFVFRPGAKATFDSFFLMWALTLRVVREQWRRIVFMQTNREDVGQRYQEIQIPLPTTQEECEIVAAPFKAYYEGVAKLRQDFLEYLEKDDHHYVFFAASAEALVEESLEDDEQEVVSDGTSS